MEVFGQGPMIVVDGAHNPAAARVFADALADWRRTPRRPTTLIVGMMRDKTSERILAPLLPLTDTLILTQADLPRASTGAELRALLAEIAPSALVALTPVDAMALAKRSATPSDLDLCHGLLDAGRRDCVPFRGCSLTCSWLRWGQTVTRAYALVRTRPLALGLVAFLLSVLLTWRRCSLRDVAWAHRRRDDAVTHQSAPTIHLPSESTTSKNKTCMEADGSVVITQGTLRLTADHVTINQRSARRRDRTCAFPGSVFRSEVRTVGVERQYWRPGW